MVCKRKTLPGPPAESRSCHRPRASVARPPRPHHDCPTHHSCLPVVRLLLRFTLCADSELLSTTTNATTEPVSGFSLLRCGGQGPHGRPRVPRPACVPTGPPSVCPSVSPSVLVDPRRATLSHAASCASSHVPLSEPPGSLPLQPDSHASFSSWLGRCPPGNAAGPLSSRAAHKRSLPPLATSELRPPVAGLTEQRPGHLRPVTDHLQTDAFRRGFISHVSVGRGVDGATRAAALSGVLAGGSVGLLHVGSRPQDGPPSSQGSWLPREQDGDKIGDGGWSDYEIHCRVRHEKV